MVTPGMPHGCQITLVVTKLSNLPFQVVYSSCLVTNKENMEHQRFKGPNLSPPAQPLTAPCTLIKYKTLGAILLHRSTSRQDPPLLLTASALCLKLSLDLIGLGTHVNRPYSLHSVQPSVSLQTPEHWY